MSMTPLLKQLLESTQAIRSGDGWSARCPVHGDQRRSMTVHQRDDGRILLYCHARAGCTFNAIVAALGLRKSDLAPPGQRSRQPRTYETADEAIAARARRLGPVVAKYYYRDMAEQLVAAVARFAPKNIRPFHLTPAGWKLGAPGLGRPLYRLPEVRSHQGPVIVVEGEGCVEAVRGLGLVATTSMMGAKSPGKTSWVPLAGRDVTIIPDADEAGEGYAKAVSKFLLRLQPSPRVRVVRLPGLAAGEDIVEWLERGGMRDQLERLIAEVTPKTRKRKQYDWEAAAQRGDPVFGLVEKIRNAGGAVEFRRVCANWRPRRRSTEWEKAFDHLASIGRGNWEFRREHQSGVPTRWFVLRPV